MNQIHYHFHIGNIRTSHFISSSSFDNNLIFFYSSVSGKEIYDGLFSERSHIRVVTAPNAILKFEHSKSC